MLAGTGCAGMSPMGTMSQISDGLGQVTNTLDVLSGMVSGAKNGIDETLAELHERKEEPPVDDEMDTPELLAGGLAALLYPTILRPIRKRLGNGTTQTS